MKHLIYDVKKVFSLFLFLILGLSLLFYGIFSYTIDMKIYKSELSDREIIERAKALGMVELKEALEEKK